MAPLAHKLRGHARDAHEDTAGGRQTHRESCEDPEPTPPRKTQECAKAPIDVDVVVRLREVEAPQTVATPE